MPAAKDDKSSGKADDVQQPNPAGGPAWDPASVPPGEGPAGAGPSLAEEEQRQFHATHFTADPRGAAMAGKPPPGRARHKHRGGTPPAEDAPPEHTPRPKRRGGTPPPADVDPSSP